MIKLLFKLEFKKVLLHLLKISGLVLGFFLIYWFINASDIDRIWMQIGQIGWKFVFILAATFTAQIMVTQAWRMSFIDKPEKISLLNLYTVRLMGESLAQINPTNFVAGETLKAMVLFRKGISYRRSVSSLTIARITIWLSSITLITAGVAIGIAHTNGVGKWFLIPLILLGFLSAVSLFVWLLQRGGNLFTLPFKFFRTYIIRFKRLLILERKLRKIDSDLSTFYHERRNKFYKAYLLSLLHWLGGATEFYLILTFLGVDVSFFSCIAIEVGVMCFKAMGSFIPGQIGVEEYANRLMLSFVGMPGDELWVSVSLFRRARQLFWITMGTVVFGVFTVRNRKQKLTDPAVQTYGNPVHNA